MTTTKLADMAIREAQRAHVDGLDTRRPRASTPEETHYSIDARTERTDVSLTAQLGLSNAMIDYREADSPDELRKAWAAGRAALAPLCDAADRLELARTLLRWTDNYDGGDERNPVNFTPYAAAEGVAHYLIAGELDHAQPWSEHWIHAGSVYMGKPLAWLRDQMLEAESSYREYERAFALAARMLSCTQCDGSGVVTAGDTYNGGQDAVEERCPTCGGSGCGDCARVSEDDERGPRGAR